MAKTKNEAKRNDSNEVVVSGIIKRVNYSSDKMASYNLEITTTSPKGNAAKTWVDVNDFGNDVLFEENDAVAIKGHLMTQSFESKGNKCYKVVVVADEITQL